MSGGMEDLDDDMQVGEQSGVEQEHREYKYPSCWSTDDAAGTRYKAQGNKLAVVGCAFSTYSFSGDVTDLIHQLIPPLSHRNYTNH